MTGVRVEVDDAGVAVVTLDGEARLNAFSAATGGDLGAAYRRCDLDDDVRAVVLTGAGRAFCAGADLSEHAGSFDAPGDDFTASPIRPPAWRVHMSGQEAAELGIASRSLPAPAVLPAAIDLARDVAT